jgi:hypothetical protein
MEEKGEKKVGGRQLENKTDIQMRHEEPTDVNQSKMNS